MKSITVKKYFEIVNPDYVFLKLTPLKSLRNYNSDKILNVVSTLFRSLTQRIQRENMKFFFNVPVKVSYYIYMEKGNIEFYFIVPVQHKTLLLDKIGDVWKGITIEEVGAVPFFEKESIKYVLNYRKSDAFSLVTDKRNNSLLSALTSTAHVLEEGDKVGVLYNFIPVSQGTWKADYDNMIENFLKGFPIGKNKDSISYVCKLMGRIILGVVDVVLASVGEFVGANKQESVAITHSKNELSDETKRKRDLRILSTQIAVLSDGPDKSKAIDNAVAVCESFKTLTGDNELIYRKLPARDISLTDHRLKIGSSFNASALESQNFLSLPGKEIIEAHKIKCIDTYETRVPEQLRRGVFSLGDSIYKGIKEPLFLSNDIHIRNLAYCIVGPNRSGKSTLIANLIHDALSHGESVFIPDFCGNCEMTKELETVFGSRMLIINCNDYEHMQGFGYNEVESAGDNAFLKYDSIKKMAIHLSYLINNVNEEDRALKAKMDRYLEAACLVVYMQNGTLNDVFDVLQMHEVRHRFVDNVPEDQANNLKRYIGYLLELDEKDKSGNITGTKLNNIMGIIDRLNILMKNTYIELMLNTDCKNNINLVDEIQKPQIIAIRMPERMFPISQVKDIFVSYWWSKLWLALQIREACIDRNKRTKLNIFIDESYQVPKCEAVIAEQLPQMPKFTAKLIVSCHSLEQIETLHSALRGNGASYSFIHGSHVSNFKMLKTEFEQMGYSVEDLLSLKRYNMLHLIKYEEGSWAGVSYRKPKIRFET